MIYLLKQLNEQLPTIHKLFLNTKYTCELGLGALEYNLKVIRASVIKIMKRSLIDLCPHQ